MFLAYKEPQFDYTKLDSMSYKNMVSGSSYLAEVSFNSTNDIMILRVDAYFLTAYYIYARK